MNVPAKRPRRGRASGFLVLFVAAAFTLSSTLALASPNSETIQAIYSQADRMVSVTLTIYEYSSAADLQSLSRAFQDGQDSGLATALSKTKTVGRCSITGAVSYEIAFIQTILTPTGRRITFVTSRPHPVNENDPLATPRPFDLAIGQFDLNDSDNSKSTGFLYPASKLVVDAQGELRYDLAGNPWSLVNVLDSKAAPEETSALGGGRTSN